MRDAEGGWPQALAPKQLRQAVYDNLDHLGLDALDVVNLRVGGFDSPTPGSIAEPFTVLAQLQQEGLIKHLGMATTITEMGYPDADGINTAPMHLPVYEKRRSNVQYSSFGAVYRHVHAS